MILILCDLIDQTISEKSQQTSWKINSEITNVFCL